MGTPQTTLCHKLGLSLNDKFSLISQPIWMKLWILNLITIPNKSYDTTPESLKVSKFQTFKLPNLQTFKLPNLQFFKLPNFQNSLKSPKFTKITKIHQNHQKSPKITKNHQN